LGRLENSKGDRLSFGKRLNPGKPLSRILHPTEFPGTLLDNPEQTNQVEVYPSLGRPPPRNRRFRPVERYI
jgi:hypothetical protein